MAGQMGALKRTQRSLRIHAKLIRMSMAVTVGYLVAWTPYAVVCMWSSYGNPNFLPQGVKLGASLFCKSATAYNPFIYYFMSEGFRADLRWLWRRCCFKDASPDGRWLNPSVASSYRSSTRIRRCYSGNDHKFRSRNDSVTMAELGRKNSYSTGITSNSPETPITSLAIPLSSDMSPLFVTSPQLAGRVSPSPFGKEDLNNASSTSQCTTHVTRSNSLAGPPCYMRPLSNNHFFVSVIDKDFGGGDVKILQRGYSERRRPQVCCECRQSLELPLLHPHLKRGSMDAGRLGGGCSGSLGLRTSSVRLPRSSARSSSFKDDGGASSIRGSFSARGSVSGRESLAGRESLCGRDSLSARGSVSRRGSVSGRESIKSGRESILSGRESLNGREPGSTRTSFSGRGSFTCRRDESEMLEDVGIYQEVDDMDLPEGHNIEGDTAMGIGGLDIVEGGTILEAGAEETHGGRDGGYASKGEDPRDGHRKLLRRRRGDPPEEDHSPRITVGRSQSLCKNYKKPVLNPSSAAPTTTIISSPKRNDNKFSKGSLKVCRQSRSFSLSYIGSQDDLLKGVLHIAQQNNK